MPVCDDVVLSPCVRQCHLDTHTGSCRGCGRTMDEIARWGTMTPDERRQVLARLAASGRSPRR